MSETIGHSAFTPTSGQRESTRDILEGLREPARREEVNELLEALEMATAEKTVLEEADRERHRLRPISEWTEADGEVLWYDDVEDQYPLVATRQDLDGDEQFWLPLPDKGLLWVR